MKVCNGNTWTNTLTFIYIDNVIMTSFIHYFIVTAENLIWLWFFYFSVHGDQQKNIYLQHWFAIYTLVKWINGN